MGIVRPAWGWKWLVAFSKCLVSCCSRAGVCRSSSGLRGEKGLGTAEGQGLKRTVLLGAEPVCCSAAFGHATGQGHE